MKGEYAETISLLIEPKILINNEKNVCSFYEVKTWWKWDELHKETEFDKIKILFSIN